MIHQISWQQYLAAVLTLTACWYLFVLLRFRKPAVRSANPMPAVNAQVIGKIQPDEGESQDAEELIFSVSSPDDISDQTVPRGPGDDFLDEAQTLADAAETKLAFLSLLELLVSKYQNDPLDFPILFGRLVLPYAINQDEWPLIRKASA